MEHKVLDIARTELVYAYLEDPVHLLADAMAEENIDSILITDKGMKTVGIVTVGDILRRVAKKKDLSSLTAGDIMSSPLIKVSKDMDFAEALKLFKEKKITRLPLSDKGGKIVGIVRADEVEKFKNFIEAKSKVEERVCFVEELPERS